jgi:hypothetical protein
MIFQLRRPGGSGGEIEAIIFMGCWIIECLCSKQKDAWAFVLIQWPHGGSFIFVMSIFPNMFEWWNKWSLSIPEMT